MARIAACLLSLLTVAATAAPLPEIHLEQRADALRIAVTGDSGRGAEAVANGIRRVHAATPFDAIVLTGDNFYPCGVSSAKDPRWSLVTALTRIGPPVLPVLGNHDFCGKADPDAQIRAPLARWMFPARQYAARAGIADLVFLDTTPFMRGRGREPEAAIREGFASSASRWRIVVGHHPILSSGYHGYFPRKEVGRMRELIPALREARVDLYICGHDHHLELIEGRPRYLVSGAGSDPVPPLKLRLQTLYPTEVRRERIGFAVVELDRSRLRVRFYDENGRAMSPWIP